VADDRYTAREKQIAVGLDADLGTDYSFYNLPAISSATAPTKYSVLIAFSHITNEPSNSATDFYADRQHYVIIGKAGPEINSQVQTQCNIMLEAITDSIRTISSRPPWGMTGMTQFRVESAGIVENKNELATRVVVSGLVDETYS
jgi:hypothetical protein